MTPTLIDDGLIVSLYDELIQLEQIESRFQSIEIQYLKYIVQCMQFNTKPNTDEYSIKQQISTFMVLKCLLQRNVNDKR